MVTKAFVAKTPDPHVHYRVRFETDKARVLSFVVQLEYEGEEGWQPVIRYDTAHGFAHVDRYSPDGSVKRHELMAVSDYDEGLTIAINTVKTRYAELAEPFRESAHE